MATDKKSSKAVSKPRTKSPRRMAAALSKQLNELERLQDEVLTSDDDAFERFEQQKTAAIKAAVKAGLKLITVQVADGYSFYYEANRTSRLVTFQWLDAGGDLYVSHFGKRAIIPIAEANKLLKAFNPDEL